MNRDKQIEEMETDIGEKQECGWRFVGKSEYTTDVFNKELAEHLVVNKGYRKQNENEASELIRKLKGKVEEAKTEVAREIFEEIYDRLMTSFPTSSFIDAPCTTENRLYSMIAELKKKYTEGEQCPDCKHFVGCEQAIWTKHCEEFEKGE